MMHDDGYTNALSSDEQNEDDIEAAGEAASAIRNTSQPALDGDSGGIFGLASMKNCSSLPAPGGELWAFSNRDTLLAEPAALGFELEDRALEAQAESAPEPDENNKYIFDADEAPGDARFDAPPPPETVAPSTPNPVGRVLGVRLRKAGQVYFIVDAEHTVRLGTKIVVELEQGVCLGEVVSIFKDHKLATQAVGGQSSGKVLGLATAQDIAQHAEYSILAAEASAFCKTCIRQRKLDMKLVDVEVLHDRSKIIFFFTAPSRIDFRELVKDLVRNYRTRIELRQIGVRHETQMIGGLGNCGMVCCCHQYLRAFAPVTIKMAKEQNLFLNPTKLSGMCGRLLCCLSFEQGNYEEFNRHCPKLGKRYATSKGIMKVLRANMFNRSITVIFETGEEIEMTLEDWADLEPTRTDASSTEQQHQLSQHAGGGRRPHNEAANGQPADNVPGVGAGQAERPHRQRKRRKDPR